MPFGFLPETAFSFTEIPMPLDQIAISFDIANNRLKLAVR
jgi:hypothetical protein